MLAAKGVKSCLLIGCLGVPALLIGGCFVFVGVVSTLDPPDSNPEVVVREQPLPGVTFEPGSDEDPTTSGHEIARMLGATSGVVHLDISMAELVIEPGRPGEPIRVEADYDAGAFELRETLDQTDGGWRYELVFDNKVSMLRFLKGRIETLNRVYLTLPPDLPFTLEGSVSMAESDIELGGLQVQGVDLELGAGEHTISFAESLPSPMSAFFLDGSFGDIRIHDLGNASPLTTRIDFSAGSLSVDLEGDWRNDGEVRVAFGFGECSIDLPRDVPARIESARVLLGERQLAGDEDLADLSPDQPKLHIWAKGTAGEIRIR